MSSGHLVDRARVVMRSAQEVKGCTPPLHQDTRPTPVSRPGETRMTSRERASLQMTLCPVRVKGKPSTPSSQHRLSTEVEKTIGEFTCEQLQCLVSHLAKLGVCSPGAIKVAVDEIFSKRI
jgi:hypothetical protein